MEGLYTLVVESPNDTLTYEFNDLEEAIKALRKERDTNIDSDIYLLDDMGDVLNIK